MQMENKNTKIVFMGTPEFAIPTLELLHKEFGVTAVVTLPDKPQGRGLLPKPTPVKTKADALGIPVLQPESLKSDDFISELEKFEPEIIVVVAFKILPPRVFNLAKIASFNVHPSLLPKYRGPAPINWTIINGERITGITTFVLQEEVDAGNIILQKEYEIPEDFTAGDLHDFLAPKCAELAVETCRRLISGNFELLRQDNFQATKAPKIFPEQCQIEWNKSPMEIRNFIHGVSPVPGAWTIFEGKRTKIFRCTAIELLHSFPLGTIHNLDGKLAFACNGGFIVPTELLIEGKRKMDAVGFFNGYAHRLGG